MRMKMADQCTLNKVAADALSTGARGQKGIKKSASNPSAGTKSAACGAVWRFGWDHANMNTPPNTNSAMLDDESIAQLKHMGIPVDRDRRFWFIVTGDSGLS